MRVLVTWGSKRGGTEGIARVIAETLAREGHEPMLLPPREALDAHGFDAAIVGGALYATRWHHDARRFVQRRSRDLSRVPTWFFSSGPLDDSASEGDIPPTRQVAILMERVGARGHATFGGRLEPDARGFPASAMAKKRAGDHRDMERVRAWAEAIAREAPSAKPLPVGRQRGRSLWALVLHAAVAWALAGAVMSATLWLAPLGVGLAVNAVATPLLTLAVALHYFRYRGAHDPLPSALCFAAVFALLDIGVVAGLVQGDTEVLASVLGLWLPTVLVFLVTWVTGVIASMSPMSPHPKPS